MKTSDQWFEELGGASDEDWCDIDRKTIEEIQKDAFESGRKVGWNEGYQDACQDEADIPT